jgi:hypothetical protein
LGDAERFAWVRGIAEEMMTEHLDSSWTFGFSTTRKYAGICNHESRTIVLARWHALLSDEYSIRNTMQHEIAHALIPYVWREPRREDHGKRWQEIAQSLGCNLYWTFDGYLVAPWRAECEFGHKFYWVARPDRIDDWSCGYLHEEVKLEIVGRHTAVAKWGTRGELNASGAYPVFGMRPRWPRGSESWERLVHTSRRSWNLSNSLL